MGIKKLPLTRKFWWVRYSTFAANSDLNTHTFAEGVPSGTIVAEMDCASSVGYEVYSEDARLLRVLNF